MNCCLVQQIHLEGMGVRWIYCSPLSPLSECSLKCCCFAEFRVEKFAVMEAPITKFCGRQFSFPLNVSGTLVFFPLQSSEFLEEEHH